MGCVHVFVSNYLTLIMRFFLFLLILSSTQLRFNVQAGRPTPKSPGISQETRNEDEKIVVRGRIGSRPPRCERRCSSCALCEAVQVPTNPQRNDNSSSLAYYSRGDESNYKPMSWKCKCGNLIFNP